MDDIHEEIARLHRWKQEALIILEQIDRCHELLPLEDQAKLGESKINAVEKYIHKTLM